MKNKRRVIGILTAAILAIIGTISLVGYVQSAKNKAVGDEELVDVYVVDVLVPLGADPDTIKSSVSLKQVPTRLRQKGAITDLDAVGSFVAATDLLPGDQLLAARLVARQQVTEAVTDKVQVAALLSAERAVGGDIQKGDLVGVYLSFDPFDLNAAGQTPATTLPVDPLDTTVQTTVPAPTRSPNVSRLEFQHVLVTNVQTISAPVSPDDKNAATGVVQVTDTQYVVTLALSPEQSERFVFATEFGHVWLSIEPASVEDDGTRTVTLDNMFLVVS